MFVPNWLICALSFATFGVIKGDSTRAQGSGEQLEVLARAKSGDPEALTALYDQYVERIYLYIYRRVGRADVAEDLTAQVFMRMLEAVQSDQSWHTSFSGWLYRIAHNQVIDYYRRRSRATLIDLDRAEPVHAREGDPVRATELQLDKERLRAAVSQLTEDQAQVISLRFLDELSIAEVAGILSKTEGAIKALQYRAVLALRQIMQS